VRAASLHPVLHQEKKDAPLRKPEGGYQSIPTAVLALAWWRYRHEKAIRLDDVRVWFAAWEMTARRLGRPDPTPRRFGLDELQGLTGLPPGRLKKSLPRLQAAGLLAWSESALEFPDSPAAVPVSDRAGFERFVEKLPRRRIPVPRRILRMLAGKRPPALIAVVLGCSIRCLRFKDGALEGRGRVKASWIAEAFGVSLRRIQQARRDLIAIGWLIPLEADQWQLNRWGAHVRIDLAWSGAPGGTPKPAAPPREAPLHGGAPADARRAIPDSATASAARAAVPTRNLVASGRSESSPPPADSGAKSSPPDLNSKPFQEEKNQKPASGGPTGVSRPRIEGEKPKTIAVPTKPILRDVKPEDLADVGRLLALYDQAVDQGVAAASEFGRQRFIAAAEHARAIGTKNPCGLFARLVRDGLWHFATQDDETKANKRLKRHLHEPPPAPQSRVEPASNDRPQSRSKESDDARMVRATRAAAVDVGWRGDPFLLLRRGDATWTRDRWNRASAQLDGRFPQSRDGRSTTVSFGAIVHGEHRAGNRRSEGESSR